MRRKERPVHQELGEVVEELKVKQIDTPDGIGLGIEIDSENAPDAEQIAALLAKVIGAVKPIHYILDKDMRPVLAQEMPKKEWMKHAEKFRVLHKTHLGKFVIVTSFLGVHLSGLNSKDDANPKLFGVLIFKDEKLSGSRRTRTIERCADLHREAIAMVKRENTRPPWVAVQDYFANGRVWV